MFKITLSACLVAVGALLLPGVHIQAGSKGGPLLTKNGELTAEDDQDQKLKKPSQTFTVKLVKDKRYVIDLKSKDFDCYLRLLDSTGKEVAFNDDAEGGTFDSRIVFKAKETGDYKVVATTYDGKFGKYSLSVVEGQKQPLQTGSRFRVKDGAEIKLALKDGKASYAGDLSEKDPSTQGHYYKVFALELEKDKVYRIDQRAADQKEVDCLLFLEDAEGNQLAVNDDAEPGKTLDSRIVYKVSKTGSYRIAATTLGKNQTGKFTLDVAISKDAKEVKDADKKYRINNFAFLAPAERKKFTQEMKQYFQDQGADLTFDDAKLALDFLTEIESVDVDACRQAYTDYIKFFDGAASKQLAGFTKFLESNVKGLERLGKEIEITGMTVDGKEFDLKNLKGKVVLVDFWATWCGPCIAEMPNMLRAYEKYHKKGFEIIGVSLDRDDGKIEEFNDARDIPWRSINVADSRKLADRYDVKSIPYPVLVDAQGRVVSVRARGPQLERLLERLLAAKK